MKKLFVFFLISLVLFLTGCSLNTPNANQNVNQTQPVNEQNSNLPIANQNVNEPVAAINQKLNQNVNTTQPTDPTANWQTYRSKYGFEIKYPQGWKIVKEFDSNKEVSFGTGTYGNEGYDGEWFVFVYEKSFTNVEKLIKDMGPQFSDRQEKRENIKINGLPALKVVVTTPSIVTWSYKAIIIEQQNSIYFISNGAIKNDLFSDFYSSFRLLNVASDY